jgi:DNA ligase-1
MENVIKIIEDLRGTSSTNDKITIIKKNADNKVFTDILKYTYDDNLQYGFSENKLRNLLHDFIINNDKTWTNGFDMLNKLSESNINDVLRNRVLIFLSIRSYEEQELWINVLTKDLRCNISGKSINKAIKGLIPEFNIQQAYPIHKYPLKQGTWFCLEDKLNGINCSDVNGIMLSRQGKELSNLGHILQQLEQLSFKGYYFNGELVRKNIDNLSNGENFRLTTSIVNSDAEDKTMIDFIVFDLIPIEEFYQGKSKLKYKERLKLLKQLKQEALEKGLINLDIPKIYYEGDNIDVIAEYLEIATSEDKEGLMAIKDCEWKNKRHNGILKIKKFMTADCSIIGYEEGDGKYKGVLGSFIIDYKGNKVNVGSGYTDEQRQEYWTNRDKYIDRILEVKYKEETMDKKTKLISLQFPTFVCIREEGKEVSYN